MMRIIGDAYKILMEKYVGKAHWEKRERDWGVI
jgi:hypothetical protein